MLMTAARHFAQIVPAEYLRKSGMEVVSHQSSLLRCPGLHPPDPDGLDPR